MRCSVSNGLKALVLGIVAISIMVFSHGAAKAEEISFAGYTNGCFNCNPPPVPNTSATQTATLFGLGYVNSTFSGTTVGGFRGLGGNPQAPPIQNVNNLGAFSLSSSLANYTGNTFTLRVSFTAPEGIAGGGSSLFSATVVGAVSSTGQGGVFINFDNTPILFTFNDTNCEAGPTTCGAGSFLFSVNDLAISPGQVTEVTGQITSGSQNAIPEPTSMLLLGTGLAGLAGLVRRKLKKH